jgi:hypothetical protein
VPARILDLAEALAEKAGVESVQDYCALILMQALENERVQQRVAEFETRRGPLEGLKQIADDPEYLAEWQERVDAGKTEMPPGDSAGDEVGGASDAGPREPVAVDVHFVEGEPGSGDSPGERVASESGSEHPAPEPAQVRIPASPGFVPVVSMNPTVISMSEPSASEIVARHAAAREDEWGFLPCLRRGQPVPAAKAAELIRALRQLEDELRGAEVISRKMAHALHRLGLESQVMLTDAWPDAFDDRTVRDIRTVQEAVERVLSGQDIRYYSAPVPGHPEQPL